MAHLSFPVTGALLTCCSHQSALYIYGLWPCCGACLAGSGACIAVCRCSPPWERSLWKMWLPQARARARRCSSSSCMCSQTASLRAASCSVRPGHPPQRLIEGGECTAACLGRVTLILTLERTAACLCTIQPPRALGPRGCSRAPSCSVCPTPNTAVFSAVHTGADCLLPQL